LCFQVNRVAFMAIVPLHNLLREKIDNKFPRVVNFDGLFTSTIMYKEVCNPLNKVLFEKYKSSISDQVTSPRKVYHR